MRSAILGVALLSLLAGSACERNPNDLLMSTPENRPLRLATPDASFRLSAEERAKVLPLYDAEALERLLGMVDPEVRGPMLRMFLASEKPGPRAVLTHLDDPQLQAVLEEVWAPHWDLLPPEAIDEEQADIPGRAIARERRDARQRGQAARQRSEQ
jgi:hypothetical protein